jgi:hypothetical protein
MNELSEEGTFEIWHHPFASMTRPLSDGNNFIPVIQGLITTTEDENGNFWLIIRDEMEKPVCAVKMSRTRFNWFTSNLDKIIRKDFMQFRTALGMIKTLIDCEASHNTQEADK